MESAEKLNLSRIGHLALASLGLSVTLAGAAQAQPYYQTPWGAPNMGISIPMPGNAGMIQLPIPMPYNQGGYRGMPMPMPYQGGYNQGMRMPFPIPMPGQGGFMIPGNGGGMAMPFPMPRSGNGGYVSVPRNSRNNYSNDGNSGSGGIRGYDTLSYQGAPCRIPVERLPVAVTINNPRYLQTTEQAIEVWNEVGQKVVGKPFFRIVGVGQHAQGAIPIEYEVDDLPRGAAGVTMLRKGRGQIQVEGISIKTMNVPQGNLCEVITHELGHALGLDHSDHAQDMMYRSTHTHRLDSGEQVRLTQRDVDAIRWLYSQGQAVPIVASR
jgi:hypothetical protein